MLGIDTQTGDLAVYQSDGVWTSLTDWITEIPEDRITAVEPPTEAAAAILQIIERMWLTEEMLNDYVPPIAAKVKNEETAYEFGKITAFTALRALLQEEYKKQEAHSGEHPSD